ncbi:MAG TPA: bifunctional oligoribonuclease/PAP phosphatase NrnA [Actinomycetota bacterium]|nr:bifunctional oligoribonuclease/PAP phosphatase NrnA [Actinomycetota bacterium]
MSISAEDWNAARAAIESASEIVLACHQGPDGDALGSMLALQLALRERGVKAQASWGSDPFVVPKHYTFLPGLDGLSPPEDVPAAPELMVTFDCGSYERLGTLEPNAKASHALVCVDHHATNERFGTINLIDPKIAASAALTYKLILKLGIPLNRDIAICLYTGILTDTGCFKYSNTTPEIHAIAGDLLGYDIPHDEIARIVYDTHPVGFLKVLALALDRAEVIPDASMIWTWVTREDLERNGIDPEDTDGLIDAVRTADVAEVAAVLKELPDGNYKVSMRAKSTADVGALCESFGGGGHALAAGYTADGKDPRAIAETIAERLRAANAG